MDSVETNIPDDVTILDSFETCLPVPRQPDYKDYRQLVCLAVLTLLLVIFEAYAMRTRHCIANLFYPVRAKKRALWLYSKLLTDSDRLRDSERETSANRSNKPDLFDLGLRVLQARIKR